MSVVANVAINVDAANAIKQLRAVDAAAKGTQKGFETAAFGAKGLGAAIQASLGPLIAFTTAAEAVRKSLETAFARGAAEQRLKNLTGSTKEFEMATALAANAANKFGLTQTQATEAFADAYSRLNGLGYGLKEVNDIYSGFNVVAKQAGISSDDAAGSFLQLSQAMGKGVLNGDELAIILERMPQLGALLAKEMGVSAGAIKQLGSEGKITGEVIYKALERASSSAGALGSNLNNQQQVFARLSQVADQLFNTLGQALGPVVVKGAELLAQAGQLIADRWNYVANVLFPQVVKAIEPLRAAIANAIEGFDFSVISTVIQNVLIKGFNIVVAVVGNLSKVLGFVITKFKELSNNPVFKFIAEQVGRLLNSLGLTTNHVAEYKKEQQGAAEAAAKNANEFSKLPPQAVDLKAKQAAVKAELNAQLAVLAQQKQINEQNNQLIDAQRNLLKGLNDIEQQRYGTQLKYALSFQEEARILGEITKAKLEGNRLEEQSANIQAQRNIDNAYIAAEEAKLKAQAAAADLKALDVNTENYNTKKLELETIIKGEEIAQRGIGIAYQVAENTRQGAAAARERSDAVARQVESEGIVAAFAKEVADRNEMAAQAAQQMTNTLDNQVKLSNAMAGAQTTINDIQIKSLENALRQTDDEEKRASIKDQIRKLEISNAKITLLNTRVQIAADVKRQRIAVSLAQIKYKELEATVSLAAAQKVLTRDHIKALEAQRSALIIAKENLSVGEQVASEQYRAAEAVFNGAVDAANLKAAMQDTAKAAGQFAGSMQDAAGAAQATAAATKAAVGESLTTVTSAITPTGAGLLKSEEARKARFSLDVARFGVPTTSQETRGQQMSDFLASLRSREAEGQPTSAGPINIQTGPVMQQDGKNYVTLADMQNAMETVASSMFNSSRSAGARRYTGVR